MSERSFSVVVCTDGRLPYLKSTVEALRLLDYRAFELIVVCGPTPDGTREWLADLGAAVKVAACPVRNLARARNLGLALACGEIVAYLDDDAIPEPEWLADLAAAYDDAQVTAAGGIVYDPGGLKFQARFVTIDRLGYAHADWTEPAPHLSYPFSAEFPHLLGANCSFRRETLLSLGGFDEEFEFFLEETDMCARVVDAGGVIAQCERAAVHHKYARSALRSEARVVRHWRPFLKNRLYFGVRNGAGHHSPWDILRAAVDDAERWQREVARNVAEGQLEPVDAARFLVEAQEGLEAAMAAARRPRKLMTPGPPPPAFRPFPVRVAEGGRLRLALVTQDYPPGQNGGIARNVAELAGALAKMGHDVHVFTRARTAPSLDFEDGVWVHRARVERGQPPPDLVAPEKIPQEIWDHSRAMFAQVAKLGRVDFVYAPLWDCEPVAFLHDPRWPVVCALQTTLDFWLDSQPERRIDPDWMRGRGAPLLALERWVLARATVLHANSRAIVADISRRYGLDLGEDRIAYAPHGVSDWADGPAPPPGDGVRFLFVGRLESRKGIDTLLEAAPKVLRRFPEARLDIVGDDRIDEAKYKRAFLAREDIADIAGRVAFHGKVEEAALRASYRACDVLLAPSRYESFGLVYVEGMIFGKPVIGGAGGGGPEVIEDGVTGLVVPPGDVAALAQAMSRLAADPALRRAMGEAGRRRYEDKFTVETATRVWLEGVRLKLSAQTPQG